MSTIHAVLLRTTGEKILKNAKLTFPLSVSLNVICLAVLAVSRAITLDEVMFLGVLTTIFSTVIGLYIQSKLELKAHLLLAQADLFHLLETSLITPKKLPVVEELKMTTEKIEPVGKEVTAVDTVKLLPEAKLAAKVKVATAKKQIKRKK